MRKVNKKKVVKLALIFVMVGGGFCFAAAVGLWFFFPEEKVRTTLEQELSRRLDHKVSIDSVTLGLHPDFEFVARNVSVTDPRTSQRIVSAQRVRLDFDFRELLNKRFVIESIVVTAPDLELERDAAGKWNVESLIARLGRPEIPKKQTGAESPAETEVGPIGIRHGIVHIYDAKSGVRVDASKVGATFDVREDTVRVDSASILLPALEAKASGEISQVSKPKRVLEIDISLRVKKEGPLRSFGPALIPEHATIAEFTGKLEGPIDAFRTKGAFSINRLATAGIGTKGKVDATLKPEGGVFKVASLETSFGGSKGMFSGIAENIWANERTARLDGRIRCQLADALAIPGAASLSRIEASGIISGPVSLAASGKQLDLKGNLNLNDAGFTIPRLVRKQRGASASLLFDARFRDPDEVVVNSIELLIGRAKEEKKGRVGSGSEPWMHASVSASEFPLNLLDQLPAGSFGNGSVTLATEIRKAHRGETRISHGGRAVVNQATLQLDALKEPFQELDASVTWDNQKATVESATFLFAGSRNNGRAEIVDFSKPRLVGTAHADTLNVKQIVAAASRKKEREKEPASHGDAKFSMELDIAADSMDAGGFVTGPLTTTWRMSSKSHSFSPLTVQAFGGELQGSFELEPDEDGLRWTTEFEGKDLRLEDVMTQFHKGSIKARGPLETKGSLTGVATGGRENVMRSLGGDLQIVVRNGEIMEYSLLKNILLLTQVPVGPALLPGVREVIAFNTLVDALKSAGRTIDPTRVSFHKIDGDFRVTNGVARTRDMRFESGTVDLIFKGNIDLTQKVMDMKIRATPLGAVGSLMGKVPIAGGVLKGTKETILSTDFVARGPIADPEVKLEAVDKLLPGDKH